MIALCLITFGGFNSYRDTATLHVASSSLFEVVRLRRTTDSRSASLITPLTYEHPDDQQVAGSQSTCYSYITIQARHVAASAAMFDVNAIPRTIWDVFWVFGDILTSQSTFHPVTGTPWLPDRSMLVSPAGI